MVMVKDSGAPPILEFYAENLGGRGSYTGLDLFIAFDHQSLAVQSWDLTTFQIPLGLLHLTTLPMGATNSVQILQGDISFIIQEEMPDIAATFMDDVKMKKDTEFVWGMDQKASMEDLKQAIVMAPCLRLIDYYMD